ncbi:MAG: TIM barrel protein, partial [Acidobacteriaceae bacterium]|nr:TIM barrel protein [Acidobacteriaceae bacterium]
MTRRELVRSLAAAATLQAGSAQTGQGNAQQGEQESSAHREPPKEWTPRLGVLGRYTPANVEFAKTQGFTNMILSAGPRSTLDANSVTDSQIQDLKGVLQKFDMHVSALQIDGNHIASDTERRKSVNDDFVKAIELAGKLRIPYIGTQSGRDSNMPFQDQVNEIVRVYNEEYFPACERNH